MTKFKFKLFATNGEWVKEFMFFSQAQEGDFYFGNVSPHQESKTSYHASGVKHIKGEYYIPLGKGKPLKEFEGIHQLFTTSIGKLVFSNGNFGKPVSNKKLTGSVIIDINKHKRDIGITAFLLEPEALNNLERLNQIFENISFTIFKETNPWLVVGIHDSGVDSGVDSNG